MYFGSVSDALKEQMLGMTERFLGWKLIMFNGNGYKNFRIIAKEVDRGGPYLELVTKRVNEKPINGDKPISFQFDKPLPYIPAACNGIVYHLS
jgi:hypothetical protein